MSEFELRAERFRVERAKAWTEFLELSSAAGYTIEDSLANRLLFMGGYESGKEGREQYAAKRIEAERPRIIAEFVADVEKGINIDGLDGRADDAGRIWRSLKEVQEKIQ